MVEVATTLVYVSSNT